MFNSFVKEANNVLQHHPLAVLFKDNELNLFSSALLLQLLLQACASSVPLRSYSF
jgi:hypothetical protein